MSAQDDWSSSFAQRHGAQRAILLLQAGSRQSAARMKYLSREPVSVICSPSTISTVPESKTEASTQSNNDTTWRLRVRLERGLEDAIFGGPAVSPRTNRPSSSRAGVAVSQNVACQRPAPLFISCPALLAISRPPPRPAPSPLPWTTRGSPRSRRRDDDEQDRPHGGSSRLAKLTISHKIALQFRSTFVCRSYGHST